MEGISNDVKYLKRQLFARTNLRFSIGWLLGYRLPAKYFAYYDFACCRYCYLSLFILYSLKMITSESSPRVRSECKVEVQCKILKIDSLPIL